ncbi:hypothetical protein D0860_08421 [Hortaea werneckii]|uniref:Transglutaminase-like domain-containing protein n=1 Tax=Hortaea werneckii TaxID=91943 RepID=A0A3M7GDG8_HORWE|nr:hypothetical protein D0860_08421 [Hortaea werneckii]
MADEPEPMSVKDRIAALKLNQVGRVPGQQQPASSQANNGTNATTKRPPPPPPPARPNVPPRPQSTNVPTAQHHPPSANGIANQPEVEQPTASSNTNGTNGMSRPSLPPRTSTQERRNGPSLPPRAPSGPSPALPPRRPSETPSISDHALSRKPSSESVSSTATGRSSLSNTTSGTSRSERFAVRAPSFDPSTLPPLPPRQTEEQKAAYYATPKPQSKGRWGLKSTNSSPNIQAQHNGTTPPPSRRPSAHPQPAQGLRRESIAEEEPQQSMQQALPPPQPQQRQIVPPPPQRPRKSALEMGFGNKPTTSNADPSPPVPNNRPTPCQPSAPGIPPPVPKASRPDLAALQASKPKLNNPSPASTISSSTCLHCRDFTAADTHAARFPLHSLPTKDLTQLAHQLTAPFPSSPTDQARAIFTWLHHNIVYDTQAFFSGNLRPSSPQSTLDSGLAVCEGYAGLFTALALKSGLESYVISGHGKGFGFSQLGPHDPLPSYNAGHAWNAVRLPDSPACGPAGGWKLIDACWGAGHICGNNNLFKKEFAPEKFTQSNEAFGLDHFPGDPNHQLRGDGSTVGWEEYIRAGKKGCQAQFFAGYTAPEGVDESSFWPRENPIPVRNAPQYAQSGSVRFSFQKVCPHWDPLRHGRGAYYLYALQLPGEGKRMVPFEFKDGVWWCDVPARDLWPSGGNAGFGEVKVLAVTSFRGGDGRGVTAAEFRQWQGRCAMGWGYVAKWDVVV